MNLLINIFPLVTLFVVAYGQNDESEGLQIKPNLIVHEVNLNDAFDNALPSIRNYVTKKGFDPMDAPDVEIPLGLLPGLLKKKMHLHHGHIQQLSTIYRTGDVTMQYSEKKISLYLNIGFEMLDVSHEYSLRYMLYNRKGDCYGRYYDVKASMLVDIDTKDRHINLKFFKFIDVGDFKLKLEGHLADKVINAIVKVATKVFRTQVLRSIESKTYEEIDKQVREFNEKISNSADLPIVVKEVIEGHEFENVVPYEMNGQGVM